MTTGRVETKPGMIPPGPPKGPPKAPPQTSALASGTRRKRSRGYKPERVVVHDDGDGNWLVSYADMMTLLFAFFVIIAAFSTPDASKLEKLKESTSKSMGVDYVRPFTDLSNNLKTVLSQSDVGKEVSVSDTSDGLVISASGTLFFESGSVDLTPGAAVLIDHITDVLIANAKSFRIFVEGHTDDTPMHSEHYPSNWELSSARAGTVVRRLEGKGFPHSMLRPLGLADAEPLLPNRDDSGQVITENQAKNRRIVIRIQKQLPDRMKKLNPPPSRSKTPTPTPL
ncbi:flagellar motor protein MotB [Bdellovibrionota bacterium FG-1]